LRNINYPLYNIRKNNDNISLTRGSTQLLNTLIARKIYQNNTYKSVSNKLYKTTRENIQESIYYRLLNKVFLKINKTENIFISITLKILRRVLLQLN